MLPVLAQAEGGARGGWGGEICFGLGGYPNNLSPPALESPISLTLWAIMPRLLVALLSFPSISIISFSVRNKSRYIPSLAFCQVGWLDQLPSKYFP